MPETGDGQPRAQNPAALALQAKFNRGMALHRQGKLADAERICRELLRQRPNHFGALLLLGVIALQTRHTERAVELIGKAIALKPDFAEAYYNRGLALQDMKRPADALASYDQAIALKPDLAEAYNNRGNALRDLKRPADALASYDQAIALKPDFAGAHNNRSAALLDLKRPADALVSYDKAIALVPGYAEAYSSRGAALLELKRPADALASYDEAIALKPDYAEAYWNRSLCLLLLGRFEQGWRQYEWRKKRDRPIAARSYPRPLWLGEENIAGKTLFLWWEQGFGDTIQFCRYAKLAEARGAKVIMSVQQPLRGLLKQIGPTIQIIDADEVPTDFDYHCPLLSLPLAFRTTLATIPANIPYLKADVEKSLFWREKLGGKNKLRVGLVWSGGFRPNQPNVWSVNSRRNIPLAKLAALKHPDIEFYSLQKGQPDESELAELIRDNWEGPQIFDFTGLLNDFSDTAALVENLDLLISVDTSTAHLAGALGKPVWILNRFDSCWRWLLDRTDSPWYPTVKLYRQEKAGDWDDVVRRIKADLIRFHTSEGN
jgi:tetratricopeptide (TPR) repeat protein